MSEIILMMYKGLIANEWLVVLRFYEFTLRIIVILVCIFHELK